MPELFTTLARTLRSIVAFAGCTLSQIAARTAVTAPPPMQRKTVSLSLESVLTVTLGL